MEFSSKFNTVKPGWSIIYMKGSQVIIKKNVFLSLKIDFFSANSADPDRNAASYGITSGSSLFAKVPV